MVYKQDGDLIIIYKQDGDLIIICGDHVQCFDRDISLILQTREICLHKNNEYGLHKVVIYSLVLVIMSSVIGPVLLL